MQSEGSYISYRINDKLFFNWIIVAESYLDAIFLGNWLS